MPFPPCSPVLLSLGNPGPCHEISQAALCKSPCNKELSAPTDQHQPASHVNNPSWRCILQPQWSLQMTAVLVNFLTVTLWEAQSQNHSTKPFQILDPQKLWENESVCMFQASNVEGNLLCNNRQLRNAYYHVKNLQLSLGGKRCLTVFSKLSWPRNCSFFEKYWTY